MHSIEKVDLGEYRGDDYFLCGFVIPKPVDGEEYIPDADAEEWGVSVARRTPEGSNVEIVRLDNAHGQDPHIDREYLPLGTDDERKRKLDGNWSYTKMRQFLLSKWKEYADLYIRYNE